MPKWLKFIFAILGIIIVICLIKLFINIGDGYALDAKIKREDDSIKMLDKLDSIYTKYKFDTCTKCKIDTNKD